MKANNTTIENALRLAFSPEYVNALSLVELAETWSDNHNARNLELNIAAYAEQCTYKMEQEGAMLEFDAWGRLTAEIERIARVWVSLYCNEISWSNRPEWIANSVRAAINTTTTPETPNPNNTPSTMNANETKAPEFSELSHAATNIVLAAENTCNIYQNHVEPLLRSLERKAAKGVTLSLDTLAKSSAMAVIIRESIKEVKRTSYDPFSANTDDRRAASLYLAAIYICDL